jgi:hypothetical protein
MWPLSVYCNVIFGMINYGYDYQENTNLEDSEFMQRLSI